MEVLRLRHRNSGRLTMVALGPDGRPVPALTGQPRTAEERRGHLAAERRSRQRRDIDRATAGNEHTVHDDEVTSQS